VGTLERGSRILRSGETFTRDGGRTSEGAVDDPVVVPAIFPTINVASADHRDTYGATQAQIGAVAEFSRLIWDIPNGISVIIRTIQNLDTGVRVLSIPPESRVAMVPVVGFFPLSGRGLGPCPVLIETSTNVVSLLPLAGAILPFTLFGIATDPVIYFNWLQVTGPVQLAFQTPILNANLQINSTLNILPGPTA
jgi:hypothetical protein